MKEVWTKALDQAFSCHLQKLFDVLVREKASDDALERFWKGVDIATLAIGKIEASLVSRYSHAPDEKR